MEDDRLDVLVLRDEDGSYYLLPWEAVERARLPADQAAETDRLVKGDDVAGFTSSRDSTSGSRDSMSEISAMTSLRMQLALDRRSTFISALSNLLGGMATVQGSIAQNVK